MFSKELRDEARALEALEPAARLPGAVRHGDTVMSPVMVVNRCGARISAMSGTLDADAIGRALGLRGTRYDPDFVEYADADSHMLVSRRYGYMGDDREAFADAIRDIEGDDVDELDLDITAGKQDCVAAEIFAWRALQDTHPLENDGGASPIVLVAEPDDDRDHNVARSEFAIYLTVKQRAASGMREDSWDFLASMGNIWIDGDAYGAAFLRERATELLREALEKLARREDEDE